MGLVMKKDSQWWYGDCRVGGKRHVIPLGVAIKGERGNLEDSAFAVSRVLARQAFIKARDELRTPAAAESRLRRLQEIQTGKPLQKFTLADLPMLYRNKQRKKRPSQNSIDQGVTRIARFLEFMKANHPEVVDLVSVSDDMAVNFIQGLEALGLTYSTLNRYTESLHAAFNGAVLKRAILESPFKKVEEYDEESSQVHRQPFTPEQVAAIYAHVKAEPVVEPVIVTGLSTGMRRKNCALVDWSRVNLKSGMIRVKAFKTKAWQVIPILPPLRALLEAAPTRKGYCFPEAAAMYLKNPDGLNLRFKRVLAAARIYSSAPTAGKEAWDDEEVGRRVRAPSVDGFAACKTTFVTISLNAGIPEMMVRKVVGNQVVDLVLKHYYQIGDEELKKQFLGKLPAEMTGGKPTQPALEILGRMEKLLAGVDATNWPAVRTELEAALNELRQTQA